MEKFEIGTKIKINKKEFEIIDIWEGYELDREADENTFSDVLYANLKDTKGKIIGPVLISASKYLDI